MAVSMISMNSISYSNYDSGSGGGSSGLLDFGSGNSGGDSSAMDASAMPMDQSAMAPMDTTSMAPQMDSSQMTMDPSAMAMAPSDSFQSSAPADYAPPPQAAPGPSGGFDFVA